MQVWKKIRNPSEQEQEALKSSNIFSYGVQASIDSRIPGASLPAGLLSNSCLWHWNPFLRCAQSFPHLFYLMRFAHIGSDTEELDDVQEAFQYLVILWMKSYFLLHDWEICQDVEFPDSIWFTQQKRRVQKRLDFSTEEEKHPTISLSKCIPRYEGVASKRKFSLPLISLQGGSNFTAHFSDRKTRNMKQSDLDFQKSAETENSHHLKEMDS